MKKVCSFALILLSLLSCIVFSACGDKYRKLDIRFYSQSGEVLSSVDLMIDTEKSATSKTIGIELLNIDEDEVGQILVYSIPSELVTVSNYVYNGNMCYVNISPNMSSDGDAKLVVTHLASGKKANIALNIDQKAININVINSKYIVSIPGEDETNVHTVDLSKTYELYPSGSTDKMFFKLDKTITVGADNRVTSIDGLKVIPLEGIEGYENVYTGFEVSEYVDDLSSLKIYPVTYMKGYEDDLNEDDLNKFSSKSITVEFRRTLNTSNLTVASEKVGVDFNNIQLVANDTNYNTFKLTLKSGDTELKDTKYFDIYEISFNSANPSRVTAFADSNNDIILRVHAETDELVDVDIILSPKGVVGDIEPVLITVEVKGELKPEIIQTKKNGAIVSTSEEINIFDYYEEGNSLGSLFTFEPITHSEQNVNAGLNEMLIYVKPEILSNENSLKESYTDADDGSVVKVNTKLYALNIHLFNQPLRFDYNEELNLMVSTTKINKDSRVYIKYIKGGGRDKPSDFGITVKAVNNSTVDYWEDLPLASADLNFIRLEGVKSMNLQAGYYHTNDDVKGTYEYLGGVQNPEYIYIDILKGIDKADDKTIFRNFIDVTNKKVFGMDDVDYGTIDSVKFDVIVTPLSSVQNPLTIYNGLVPLDDESKNVKVQGFSQISYTYNSATDDDVISLIVRDNTSIGDYEVTFYQEGVKKASVIVRIYKGLTSISEDMVSLETNATAFTNELYKEKYNLSEIKDGETINYPMFIVASGQKLDISVDLSDLILNSQIVQEYDFTSFEIVDSSNVAKTGEGFDKTKYFKPNQDDKKLNYAVLDFKQGTFIDSICYVKLNVVVRTTKFDNLVTIATSYNEINYTIGFFIYEKIESENISINHTSMDRYFSDYLGVYYQEDSKAELKIEMAEELWNYVTTDIAFPDEIEATDPDGTEPIEIIEEIPSVKQIHWAIDKNEGVTSTASEYSYGVEFKAQTGLNNYTRTVKAYVCQFDQMFEFQCVFNVEKPILTERVVIESDLIVEESTQNVSINLKESESYQVIAKNYSQEGEVTNSEIIIQVADQYGSAFTASKYFEINQNTSTITVKEIGDVNNFKLIIFAKDVLKEIVSSDKSGYNIPSTFIKNDYPDAPYLDKFLGAYFIIDIVLSNGSEDNPYLIRTANDFWQIDDNEHFRTSHYLLNENISLDGETEDLKTINNFSGTIRSGYISNGVINEKIYTIDGINLNNTNKNLFVGFNGEIKGVQFVVNYTYNLTTASGIVYLGLFDVNNGKIQNCGVYVSGTATLEGKATYLFGGMVAENLGEISFEDYEDDDQNKGVSVGVRGKLGTENKKVSTSTATVYLGGLVGKNVGTINGSYIEEGIALAEEIDASGNEIILITENGRSKALSLVEIYADLGNNSAIGGVVGLNTYLENKIGTIQNGFAQSIINAPNTSNVGGVTGQNIQETATSLNVGYDDQGYITVAKDDVEEDILAGTTKAIYNVKSASIINAKNNVGGIVGLDTNGLYIECDYQVLNRGNKTISISANSAVGGIAGSSENGKFAFCSVMSYYWKYNQLNIDNSLVISDVADISAKDCVGGIVGLSLSDLNQLNSGDNEVSSSVVILSSSVNAYIQANNEGNIGGIFTSETGTTILYNVYFIGQLEGNVVYQEETISGQIYKLSLTNKGNNVYYNAVYTLNLEKTDTAITPIVASFKDDKKFDVSKEDFGINHTFATYWWWNENINGGYIFITTDTTDNENKLPIFDVAPDSITVNVKEEYRKENLENVLTLYYYDFSIASNADNNILLELNNTFNRNKIILELLDITAKPDGLGDVVVNVISTKASVVDVTYDGKLLINGIGECYLVFSSALNPNVQTKLKVVVDYPLGNFAISTNQTDASKKLTSSSILGIPKDTSKQLYVLTNGTSPYGVNSYAYKTKSNPDLKVEVSYTTTDENFKVEDYIRISGNTTVSSVYSGGKSTLTIYLNSNTPFTIEVIKDLEGAVFDVKVIPYVIIEKDNEILTENIDIEFDSTVTFKVSTSKGVTSISFSYDEAIVYPNDIVYLTIQLGTDLPICANEDGTINVSELQTFIENILNNDSENIYINTNQYSTNIIFNIYVDSSNYNYDKLIQTIVLRIEFNEMELNEEEQLTLTFIEETYNTSATVDYTILPQRINKIEIKNYYYKQDEGTTVRFQADILKPNTFGEIIIDIVPDNGYYDYLEISDITGNEEILFIQMDEEKKALDKIIDSSSDGKGIKLYTIDGKDNSRLYVRTQISNTYSSKMHTLQVRAYSAQDVLLATFNKQIEVKMLPDVTIQLVNPDGSAQAQSQASQIAQANAMIADKVDTNIRIITTNSNAEPEIKLSSSTSAKNNYEIVHLANNNYILKVKDPSISLVGETITLTVKTYAYMDNGDYDEAECSMTFKIVSFVIHDISVNSSIDNANTKEIYGYFDRAIKLNFYFDKDDISFYDTSSTSDPYWDTVYEYSVGIENTVTGELQQIYTILKELNGYEYDSTNGTYSVKENNYYLVLNNTKTTANANGVQIYDTTELNNITLTQNILTVEDARHSPDHLAVAFRLYYYDDTTTANADAWKIEPYTATTEGKNPYIINKNYKLNFIEATQWFEPTVVNNEDDFRAMSSGGQYILNADLQLKDYIPLDVNLIEFDGNGHTIEILSFGQFNDVALQAGLFKQIYANMIVKNVKVVYQSTEVSGNYSFGYVEQNGEVYSITYSDLCNNKSLSYTSVKFGGLAAINNGMVTNCYVTGQIAVNASTLETSLGGSNYQIDFEIGGMVAENSSTGYITHSTSELNIFALANIGGFVHSNQGKIVSCGVEENTTIYAYNVNLGNTFVVETAGFAVENSGEISMSYVNLVAKDSEPIKYYELYNETISEYYLNIQTGKMSAKDISAGFVYSNTGKIYDAYAQMTETGVNNNSFAGFVYANSGTIIRAYTYINGGSKLDNNDSMFAPAKISGLTNCIEFVINKTGYTNGISAGLITVNVANRFTKAYYEEQGFAFGDNASAVWMIITGSLPRLVSTQEVTLRDSLSVNAFKPLEIETLDAIIENGVEKISYKVHYSGIYGTKQNPYIIHNLEMWNLLVTADENKNSYFRIINDIDFSNVGTNPTTSTLTFSGNIQGNNMVLNGIMLYSSDNLSSIGLFAKLEGTSDNLVKNSIRNLTITVSSVWASSTNAVGVLAGIVQDFNLYNINIDAENVIMVGKNAVGGLAGIVRGEFDIDQISSNIGVNSTRASTLSYYSIYMSKNNNKDVSYNLSKVYYGGSIVGILDGYNNTPFMVTDTEPRNISKKYFMVRNITVEGNIVNSGDTVGTAFGMVGERVYVKFANINVSGALNGTQYSAGLVGENRGVLDTASVILADNMFNRSTNVSSGAVGLNLGGLVRNVNVTANISKSSFGQIVGGAVGRNINGTVSNINVDGELFAYITGGIVGADYNYYIFTNATTGSGAVDIECKNANVIPKDAVAYKENTADISHYSNVSLSRRTLEYLITNSTKYYTYKQVTSSDPTLSDITVESKVLGLVVGLSCDASNVVTIDTTTEGGELNYLINLTSSAVTFNGTGYNVEFVQPIEGEEVTLKQDVTFKFGEINTLEVDSIKTNNIVMYLVGAVASSFDSWAAYSDHYVIVNYSTN